MPWTNEREPSVLERVVAGLSYLTMGFAGLLYIIFAGRSGQSMFFRFHFMQAIILGILGLLFSWATGFFVNVTASILGMFDGSQAGVGSQILHGLGLAIMYVGRAAMLLLVYGMIWAFLGKYAEIPFVSDMVRRQTR